MAVLEGIQRKTTFASGAVFARQQLSACDLPAVCHFLQTRPLETLAALERTRQQYRFPAQSAGLPLLVDEGLRFPVSLSTALQTSAMYQKLNWDEPVTRRYLAAEFFRKYTELLLKESVKLALTRQIGPDLALGNLVIVVSRGEPSALQIRQVGGLLGPAHLQAVLPSRFGLALDFYPKFVALLLEHNLRPMVEKLIEISRAKPDVLWDCAIEAMLNALDGLETVTPEISQLLLVEELDPGERTLAPASASACATTLQRGQVIYLKRRCCEKFKRKSRCSNCPGLRRAG